MWFVIPYTSLLLSYLLNKSEFNILSARLLIDNDYYVPSVHCSYYSVYQHIKHIFLDRSNMTEQELDTKISSDKRNSHQFIIDEFFVLLQNYSTLDRYKQRELRLKIKDLKNYRIESDYRNIEVPYNKGTMAYSLATTIDASLRKI